MRRSGRTTRIVDFAVQQLFENGTVAVHDHADYEHSDRTVEYLVKEVRKRVAMSYEGRNNPKLGVRWRRTHRIGKLFVVELELAYGRENEFKL